MLGLEAAFFWVCLILILIGGAVGLFLWRGRKVGSAPYFAGWFITWPIIAYLGAQGYTGQVVFCALVALFFLKVRDVRLYAVAFCAFLTWVVAATFWSPDTKPILIGDLVSGDFNMDMVGARFGLTMLATMAVMVALKHVPEGTASRSLGLIRVLGAIHWTSVVVTGFGLALIMELILGAGLSPDPSSLIQNLLRNANAFALLLPFLLAWIWHRDWPLWAKTLAALVFGGSVTAFALTGTQTALFGSVFMLFAMGIVRLFPRSGFKALFGGMAAYVATAPIIFGVGLDFLARIGITLPGSFFSRTKGWELVGEKITEKPLMGHGLEATYNWSETYADRPEWLEEALAQFGTGKGWENYEILNSHPHNMPLQIWVETGAIGAFLAALAVLLFGFRLKMPFEWPAVSRYAAAGLIGIAFSICSFSYSMWNEAFWASLALAAGVILLHARQDGGVSK
jgi:O-antigen ligase